MKISLIKIRKWSKENFCNEHLNINTLTTWPGYASEWLMEMLGAEYRVVENVQETLINDMVISPDYIYSVGLRAMKEVSDLTGDKLPDISNVNYEGMRDFIDKILGISITTIHRIEDYISKSFVFVVENKKYSKYTINELEKLLKKKYTLGKLIGLIEERYEINQDVYNSLQLFLEQRNKIAHGLTKDERFDIDTIWGAKRNFSIYYIVFKKCLGVRRNF